MKTIVIVGGKLQGLEAVYLGKKAGYETIVVDKNKDAPARGICNQFLCVDVLKKEEVFINACKKADMVLPAMENAQVLEVLRSLKREYAINIGFDFDAYEISSSKIASDRLMQGNCIPSPIYYPGGNYPYIAKPSSQSGSAGVTYLENELALKSFLETLPKNEDWIIQEFIQGPSYSIEVIGSPGNYKTYEVTQIHMDDVYDCKMVGAPCAIPLEWKNKLSSIAIELAKLVKLKGIMDVEVIENKGILKVLEIDARIPSQTPITIYHATGVNFLEEIVKIFSPEPNFSKKEKAIRSKNYVAFEHLQVFHGIISELGEHIMGDVGPLELRHGFCGANEVLTNYSPNKLHWVGTFISVAQNEEELQIKRREVRQCITLL